MTKTTLIENGTLYSPSGMQPDGWLLIRDGKITEKGFGSNKPAKVDRGFDAQGKWVIPGLVDLHIHGAGGFDASGKSLAGVQSVLPQYGITSFLATSYVTPRNVLEQSIRDMADVIDQKKSGAQIIGIHMEGPWLSAERHGAADPALCYALTQVDIEHYQKLAGGHIRRITFAPEEGEAMQVIPWLREHNILPSIGHTNATYEITKQVIALGVNHATHVYNAMRGLNHREPGTVGAILESDAIMAELIADGHHVHPAMMRLLIRAKSREQVCLVSDAVFPAGMPDGLYPWGNMKMIVQSGTCRLADGTLAGSIMLINKMMQVLVEKVGTSLQDAIYMASTSPARQLGLNKGLLDVGYDADVVVLEESYQPQMTMIQGNVVYER
jgi:N-acetylglucosamine-6-phosphate deacetylase